MTFTVKCWKNPISYGNTYLIKEFSSYSEAQSFQEYFESLSPYYVALID